MKRVRNNLGFTLAELMIVVAIVAILAGVGSVGVVQFKRSLAQREADSIARELFVAAQNHLTMAKSEGSLATVKGSAEKTGADKTAILGVAEKDILPSEYAKEGVYYFTAHPGDGGSVLDLMLPFGAVEDTIRSNGSYIIRYQLSTAKVLDVFYAQGRNTLSGACAALMAKEGEVYTYRGAGDAQRKARMDYTTAAGEKAMVGWFGGEEVSNLTKDQRLLEPTVELINGARLIARVSNPNYENANASLKLLIIGKSGGKVEIPVIGGDVNAVQVKDTSSGAVKKMSFDVVLDDVTAANLHFAQLCDGITPGDDITVQAMAYNSVQLTNVAYSSGVSTNSLYASLGETGDTDGLGNPLQEARIANFRHLENLDADISGIAQGGGLLRSGGVLLNAAQQIADLDWKEFLSQFSGDTTIIYRNDRSAATTCGHYYPVNLPNTSFLYSGRKNDAGAVYAIRNVAVDYSGPAGIFGIVSARSILEWLALEDCDIRSSGAATNGIPHSAGTLAGVMQQSNVNCVFAGGSSAAVTAAGANANAGGLVGECRDSCAVHMSASNAAVTASGDAGGLVGKAETLTVRYSYSGGRTAVRSGKTYGSVYGSGYNVTAGNSGSAGGLVGGANQCNILYSYSTCSAGGRYARYAGGLVGTSASGDITACYATGKVGGTAASGALAGSGTVSFKTTESWYFSFINGGEVFAMGGSTGDTDILAGPFDDTLVHYRNMTPSSRAGAHPLNTAGLETLYDFQTVAQLSGGSLPKENGADAPAWLREHYGDWPVPDTLVPNSKT